VADTEITWRGLTLGGDSPYVVQSVSGWDDLPEVRSLSAARARGHGEHVGDQFGGARIVTVEGKVAGGARDELVRALQDAAPVSSDLEPLTVNMFGRHLTAGARVVRRALTVGLTYGVGETPFALQWRCPDPLRYGPARTASTGLPTSGTGLAYPLTYPLDYGTLGNPGQITLANEGTADAPVVFDVTGPLGGFEISAGGRRITYPTAVPAGQTVTVDTGAGTVVVEGTSSRRAHLTAADWLHVPAGTALTVQFTSLGGTDPAATLTARWSAAYW
jgi:Phage tail protein